VRDDQGCESIVPLPLSAVELHVLHLIIYPLDAVVSHKRLIDFIALTPSGLKPDFER
jgi:hypothetical protein